MAIRRCATVGAVLLAAGCAAPPMGPTVQVMPGPGRTLDQFANDDGQCRNFAGSRVAGQAEMANRQAVGGAVLGTVLGAGLGAAVGGGRGAAIGAASGAGVGTGLGAGASANAQGGIQAQYDNAYAQCMYTQGDSVPGYQQVVEYVAEPVYYGRSNIVHAVQLQLNRLGYLRSPADGIAGPATVSAIQSFESRNGLPVDGTASPYLLDRLRSIPIGY